MAQLYDAGRVPTRFVDSLDDEDLARLNAMLPWKCFTADSRGRPFGRPASSTKRADPQPVPDRRIVLLHKRFDLTDKHVLELGCFEGVHTVALCALAREVTAVDARIENVVKTIVRSAFFGYSPTVFTCDLEHAEHRERLPVADICHHVGVLYHLDDPVSHVEMLARLARVGLMLDTHYAHGPEATESYEVDGRSFRFRPYVEKGRADAFSGMRTQSRWLLLDDIVGLLSAAGFPEVEVVETRDERNGPRALLFAARTA